MALFDASKLAKLAGSALSVTGYRNQASGFDPRSGDGVMTLWRITVEFTKVLDLTHRATLEALDIDPADLLRDDRQLTNEIGEAARENRFQAIRSPSVTGGRRCPCSHAREPCWCCAACRTHPGVENGVGPPLRELVPPEPYADAINAISSRSALPWRLSSGPIGVWASQSESHARFGVLPRSSWAYPARRAYSLSTPTMLRFAVGRHEASPSVDSSASMNASGTPCRRRTASRSVGNLCNTVDAGARGAKTGSNVDSLTNNTTCGFQKTAVAYHAPSAGAAEGTVGKQTHPRSVDGRE